MSEKDTGSFRFGSLEDDTEERPTDQNNEVVQLQVRKIKRRFWWLGVIMLLLVAGLFSAGYLDLKQRFSAQTNVGIREIENISTVFDDRLNELQQRLDGFETTLTEQMAALDKKTVVWQKDLAALRQTVEKMDLSGAVEKERQALLNDVRKQIAPLDQKVAALQSDLDKLADQSALADLEKKLTSRIAPLSEAIAQNAQKVAGLQDRLGPVAGEIVSKDQMDLELLKLRKAIRQDLVDEVSGLERRVGLLTEQVQRLESRRAMGPPPAPGAPQAAPGGIQEQALP